MIDRAALNLRALTQLWVAPSGVGAAPPPLQPWRLDQPMRSRWKRRAGEESVGFTSSLNNNNNNSPGRQQNRIPNNLFHKLPLHTDRVFN